MTSDDGAPDLAADAGREVQSVRRIFLVALAAALVAAGIAYGVELAGSHPSSPPIARPPALLPLTFVERGFADHVLHRVATVELSAQSRHGVLRVPADFGGRSIYVVARCSAGAVHVAAGALNATHPCRGAPQGVVVLGLAHLPLQLELDVTEAQPTRWAVGAYR